MDQKKSIKWALLGVVALLLAACSPLFAAFGIGASQSAACQSAYAPVPASLQPILQTIRLKESGDNYLESSHSVAEDGRNGSGNPTGAYQFLFTTWGGYGGYQEAYQAPAGIQDERAAADVAAILAEFADQPNPVEWVPISWYIGLGGAKAILSGDRDATVVPNANYNVLSPAEYQQRWMTTYQEVLTGIVADPAGDGAVTQPVVNNCVYGAASAPFPFDPTLLHPFRCSGIQKIGQRNALLDESLLVYDDRHGLMDAAASDMFLQMWEAANEAGYNIEGSSYRRHADQITLYNAGSGAYPGTSCHGLAIGIDIDVLVPGFGPYPTVDAAFTSGEFGWLCNNAQQYGYIFPPFALPAGMVCHHGLVVGTGTGGGTSKIQESWHLDWAAVCQAPEGWDLTGCNL